MTETPLPFTLDGMDKVAEGLDRIGRAFEKQNEILFERMNKPKDRFTSVLEPVVLVAGALGFIHIVDVIRRWVVGG